MRKKIEKILSIFILVLAIIYATVYLYLAIMGKTILISRLQEISGAKVTIGHFSISPFLKASIKDLNIKGLIKSDFVSTSVSIIDLLRGRIVLQDLTFVKPEFLISKNPPVLTDTLNGTATIIPKEVAKVIPQEIKAVPFGIARISIKDGKIIFIDQTVSSGSIKISLEELTGYIQNFYFFPSPKVTWFKLNAVIPWREERDKGNLDLDGWINFSKRDMRATVKINDIDAIYLHPYYAKWVDLERARIEKAKLNFTSEIVGLNNEVTADCHLELTDMVRNPLEIGEMEAKASKITNAVLDRFKAQDQGQVKLNFKIRTTMDSPQFGFDNFKAAFEEKLMRGRHPSRFRLQDAVTVPVKTVESGVRTFTDLSRAMIDGVFAIGNHIKDSTISILNRKEDTSNTD